MSNVLRARPYSAVRKSPGTCIASCPSSDAAGTLSPPQIEVQTHQLTRSVVRDASRSPHHVRARCITVAASPVPQSFSHSSASCISSTAARLTEVWTTCGRFRLMRAYETVRTLDVRVDCLVLATEHTLQPDIRLAGLNAGELFGQGTSYTYDDVIFHPGHIDFGAHEVRQHASRDVAEPCLASGTLPPGEQRHGQLSPQRPRQVRTHTRLSMRSACCR